MSASAKMDSFSMEIINLSMMAVKHRNSLLEASSEKKPEPPTASP
jgi:hypothetical protein